MAVPHHIFLHRNARAEVALDAPWPGTPISGDPHTVTLNGYESEDGKRLMGIWESSPGVWKVDYKDWEYCHFLEGRCILTPEGGKPIELKAGDVFVIEPGFKATWEVLSELRQVQRKITRARGVAGAMRSGLAIALPAKRKQPNCFRA